MTPQAVPAATQQQCGQNEENIFKVKARTKWVRRSIHLQISGALHKNEVYCALSGYLTVCIRGCWLNVSKLHSWHCEMQPFQALEQVRTYLSGWRSFTNTAQVGVGLHLQPLDPSQCWVALYSQSMYCAQAFETPSSLKHSSKKKKGRGGAKNTIPSKSFHLKCSQKCLIQPCIWILQLSTYAYSVKGKLPSHSGITFVSGPLHVPASEKGKGRQGSREWRLGRQTREYSSIHSGACLCMCVFLYPGYLPP